MQERIAMLKLKTMGERNVFPDSAKWNGNKIYYLVTMRIKKVNLPVGYELYFDGNELYPSKVKLGFGK
tara:strand:- start:1795 stop:1998 length:204 start_codon:yes stop_codon:yes gene_type:complete